MLRTVNDQPTLWDAILPAELLVLPAELGRVDVLLDDPVFFAPFATYFDARIGRVAFRHRRVLRFACRRARSRLRRGTCCWPRPAPDCSPGWCCSRSRRGLGHPSPA